VAAGLPPLKVAGEKTWPRVYVIGHPSGSGMAFSQQDNLLLDHEDPRVHYRAPTRHGSSGSPVFNSDWELLALHHYGHKQMAKLHGAAGFYSANEGIYIKAILDEIAQSFARRAAQPGEPAAGIGGAGTPAPVAPG